MYFILQKWEELREAGRGFRFLVDLGSFLVEKKEI